MKQLAAKGLACYRVTMLGNLAIFTEEAMEAIGHTTLENALGYEKGEIPTGNQV